MKVSNQYEKKIEKNFQRKSRRTLIAALQRIKMTGQAENLRQWIAQQQASQT